MSKRKAKPARPRKKKKKQIAPGSHPIWKQARRSAAKSPAPEEGHVLVDGILFGTGFIQEPDPKDNDFPLGAVIGAVDDPRSQEKSGNCQPTY